VKALFDEAYYNDPGYFHKMGKKYKDHSGKEKQWGYLEGGWDGFRTIIIPAMLKVVPDMGKVLDVGAGCGSFVDHAVRLGVDARGIDFAQFAVEHPLGMAKGRLSKGDARKIPFPDKSFDTVVAFDLLEHLYLDDIPAVLKEIVRVTKSWVFFNVCCLPSETGSYAFAPDSDVPLDMEASVVPGHVTVQSYHWWVGKWERHGLQVDWTRTKVWVADIYPTAQNWLPHYDYILKVV